MNTLASPTLGLFPPHRINQNIWRYRGVSFKKITRSFRLLLFWKMNLDNLKLEAGVMATCETSLTVPREVILSSVFPLSLSIFLHSLFSSCFFPCNLSLNLKNVKHKKVFPSSSLVSSPERGHLELEFSIADAPYGSSGISLGPGLLVHRATLTSPLGIPEGH